MNSSGWWFEGTQNLLTFRRIASRQYTLVHVRHSIAQLDDYTGPDCATLAYGKTLVRRSEFIARGHWWPKMAKVAICSLLEGAPRG